MKNIAIALLLSYSLAVSAQQTPISGTVSIHNSQFKTGTRQYVQNAQVEDDFGKANAATTDATGNFKLVFVGADKGKSVVLSIKKAGLQVVNTSDLTAIAGQTDALKISMAHPDSIAEYRKRLYNIGKSEAEKNLYAQLKKKGAAIEALQKDAQRNAIAIEKLQKEYAELDKYAKNIEEQAQDLARRYAPINLDDAAPLYREAFGYFQQGDLEKAMQILRGADLIGQADKILAERKAIGAIRQEANQRDSLQMQRTKDLLQVLGLKADLHRAAFQFDSTTACFELMTQLDSTDAKLLITYGLFLQKQNKYLQVEKYYQRALQFANKQEYKATILNNIGMFYYLSQKMTQAEIALGEALEIRRRLAQSKPDIYLPDVAATLTNLGSFYLANQKMLQTEAAYTEALKIYRELGEKDSITFLPPIALTLNNLGGYYYNLKMPQAEAYFIEAATIYRQLTEKSPDIFLFYVAATLNNLGGYYLYNKKIPQADTMFNEAVKINRELVSRNPDAFLPSIAMILNNLGLLYLAKMDFKTATYHLEESELIYRKLASYSPLTYELDLARALFSLGIAKEASLETQKSQEFYSMALQLFRKYPDSPMSKKLIILIEPKINKGIKKD